MQDTELSLTRVTPAVNDCGVGPAWSLNTDRTSKDLKMRKLISAILTASVLALPLAVISTPASAKPAAHAKHGKAAHKAKHGKRHHAHHAHKSHKTHKA
jgi:hypothetical protein